MRVVIAVLAIPFLFWMLVILIVPDVIRDQAKQFGEKIGYEIAVGDIELTPLLLRARLYDIRLTPKRDIDKQDALFKLKQLEVDARFWPLLAGRVSFDGIVLDEPEVLLSRMAPSANGGRTAWNWQLFAERVEKAFASETPAKPPSVKINIDEFTLHAGRVVVRDGLNGIAYELGPYSLRLTELSNQDEAGHVGGSALQSKYVLNIGGLKVPLPKVDGVPDRRLTFGKVMATGHLKESSDSVLRAALDLTLDGGEIRSSWEMTPGGMLTGNIAVEHMDVEPWLALVPSYQPLDAPSGVIDGRFELRQDTGALMVDGDLKVDKLDIRVRGSKDPLLAWASTSLSKLHLVLPRTAGKAGLLTMDEILLDQPKIRFVIDAHRQSNFRNLFSPSDTVPALATPTADEGARVLSNTKSSATTDPVPGFRYDIRSIGLKNGSMYFEDDSIKPLFRVDVTDLNGYLQGISNEPNRYASLVLNGRAAMTGSLRARGQLAFTDPRQNNDVNLSFRNIPLNATNPYAMTFAGYAIDDGRIDVDLRYVTKDGQLQGKNRFLIKKIKLGDEVPDYEGTRLPLGLAIALLEDSDGMIDVNIPVKGNVNDPEFSAGHLVWQAVKTVLTNVVTAPFRALGALLGIENLDAIAFVPGESALPPEDDELLAKVATLLAKRPSSKLVIHGSYDPMVDSSELARAMADRAILLASGLKVLPDEPLPTPNLSDPKVKAGLKSAYGSQVGRFKLAQRLLILSDTADRDMQLRQELIASYKITDEQLKQLAVQRAEAVKAKLLAADPKFSGRISIGDPIAVSASDEGVPLNVELDTGS